MVFNEGTADRWIRVVAGLAIIGAGLFYQSWWGAIGAVLLLTGAIGWCPAYKILGISTCRIKQGS